jgi:hypothetical protein
MIAVIIHPEHSKNPISKDTHNTSLITTSFENIFQNFPPGIFGKIKSRSLCITSPALNYISTLSSGVVINITSPANAIRIPIFPANIALSSYIITVFPVI